MTLHNDKDEDLKFAEPSNPPTWALQTLDLATSDEEEICAIIDDVTDHDHAYMIVDSINDGDKPLAVMIPWESYVGLMARASAHLEKVEDWHGKAGPSQEQVNREIARDVARDAIL